MPAKEICPFITSESENSQMMGTTKLAKSAVTLEDD